MCGIVGIATSRGTCELELVVRMRDAMRHRGPDDAGAWQSADRTVALGHRRLSIIELTKLGHQPMADATGELHLVFNGEIFNFVELRDELAAKGHAFRSRSDSEVLLAAYREWGDDCLPHLTGQFAFAIYDARRRRLLLARDRAGEKPLYYTLRAGALSFASETKALMADPALERRVDREALDAYLAVGYTLGERTMLAGVSKLPPAHALVFELATGALRRWRYWELPDAAPVDGDGVGEVELVDRLEAVLGDAVRRQLVADVPVGLLLSGGIDSSVVTALAARAAPRIKTFTMRFPGHGAFDETEHARRIASHFGTEHQELEVSPSDVELLPMLARQFDDPNADSSMIPTYLICRAIRAHCTVALSGDGGDELFAGYKTHRRLLRTRDAVAFVPRVVRCAIAHAAERAMPLGTRGRMWLQAVGTDFDHGVPLVGSFFDPRTRAGLMSRYGGWSLVAERARAAHVPSSPDLLQRITRLDFATYMVDDVLAKVDRASMASSLEVRAPLLDHRVIELAFSQVPPRLRATAHSTKILLKKLAARILPAGVQLERKQGFSIPLAAFLRETAWRTYFHDVLLGPDTVFDRGVVASLVRQNERGVPHSERLFALLMFELWRREYRVIL